jgi:hypothetical protein
MIKRNIYYLLIAGQRSLFAISNMGAQHAICNMLVRGIVAPGLLLGGDQCAHLPGSEVPEPKHAVREGLLALAKGQKRYKDCNPVRVS